MIDEHMMMRALIDKFVEIGTGAIISPNLKSHLTICRDCYFYLQQTLRLEEALAYQPLLSDETAFVNTIISALPEAPAHRQINRRFSWDSYILVMILTMVGLGFALFYDPYLLNILFTLLGDAAGTLTGIGQAITDWLNAPAVTPADFTSELIEQHQFILVGLIILIVPLSLVLYKTLQAPLPDHPAGHKQRIL